MVREVGGNAVHLKNFVFFLVFEIGEALDDEVDWAKAALSGEIDEALGSLRAEEVRQGLFVIQSELGGVGENLLLFGGIGRRRLAPRARGQYDQAQEQPKPHSTIIRLIE